MFTLERQRGKHSNIIFLRGLGRSWFGSGRQPQKTRLIATSENEPTILKQKDHGSACWLVEECILKEASVADSRAAERLEDPKVSDQDSGDCPWVKARFQKKLVGHKARIVVTHPLPNVVGRTDGQQSTA